MALANKRITVDGDEYELTQLGSLEGRKIWLRILKAISCVITELAAAEHIDEKATAGAAASLVQNLDEETFEILCNAFAKRTRLVQGAKMPLLDGAIFDVHFAGRYVTMTKWVGECLVFNFANFFEGSSLESTIAQLRTLATSRSKSPKASTGSSGESSPANG